MIVSNNSFSDGIILQKKFKFVNFSAKTILQGIVSCL